MTRAEQLEKEALIASHCPLCRRLASQLHRQYRVTLDLQRERQKALKSLQDYIDSKRS